MTIKNIYFRRIEINDPKANQILSFQFSINNDIHVPNVFEPHFYFCRNSFIDYALLR